MAEQAVIRHARREGKIAINPIELSISQTPYISISFPPLPSPPQSQS